jgi:hypothetical protein
VYKSPALARINQQLADLVQQDRLGVLAAIDNAVSVLELVDALDGTDKVAQPHQDDLRNMLGAIPPAIDASIRAAVRSAVDRNLSIQVVWHPGYYFGLHVEDVSCESDDGWVGHVTIALTSRDADIETTPWGSPF